MNNAIDPYLNMIPSHRPSQDHKINIGAGRKGFGKPRLPSKTIILLYHTGQSGIKRP